MLLGIGRTLRGKHCSVTDRIATKGSVTGRANSGNAVGYFSLAKDRIDQTVLLYVIRSTPELDRR